MGSIKTTSKTLSLDNQIDQIVGANLRRLRLERGFSQDKIAQRLGITFQQVQKYEKGRNRISASTLYFLSDILDVKFDEFFRGTPLNEQTSTPVKKDHAELLRLYDRLPSEKARTNLRKMLREWAKSGRSDSPEA